MLVVGEVFELGQDFESYVQMRCAIGLLKLVAHGEVDIQAGRAIASGKVFTGLRKMLTAQVTTAA